MRRLLQFNPASYDPSALAYFAAAGITNPTEKSAANKFILTLKANGIWDKLDRIYLRSPTSLAACLMCCKSLTSQTAVNSPTFTSAGLSFDGSTKYATSDIAVNACAHITTTSASSFSFFTNASAPNNAIIGKQSGGSSVFILLGELSI